MSRAPSCECQEAHDEHGKRGPPLRAIEAAAAPLRNFGVNYTVLEPGAISALHHRHTLQDEFIYVLEGELTLHLGSSSLRLTAGMCAGFPAGGEAHHLENQTPEPAAYLEIGDRTAGDHVSYPDDDLVAVRSGDTWVFTHRDGTPY